MTITQLGFEEMARTGFTHKAIVTYEDLDGEGDTAITLSLLSYSAKTLFRSAAFRLVTAFDGTSTTALAMKVGWNGATTDDDDGLIASVELHNDATEITGGDGTGAAFATLRTGYMALDAGAIEATFTSTTANLTDLTSGEVHIYLGVTDTTKI